MNELITPRPNFSRLGTRRALLGLGIVCFGTLALLDSVQMFETPMLRTFWPLILVLWGLVRLVAPRQTGSRLFGLMLLLAGGFMTARSLGYANFNPSYWWPVFIILAGAYMMLRGVFPRASSAGGSFESSMIEHNDEINVDATFSSVKLQNISRSFRGGRITMIFGGLELDLRDAVMQDFEATIEINATLSGVALRIPRGWQVVPHISATLGSVEDHTMPPGTATNKLILKGETLLGGVEIKN